MRSGNLLQNLHKKQTVDVDKRETAWGHDAFPVPTTVYNKLKLSSAAQKTWGTALSNFKYRPTWIFCINVT